MKGFKKIAVVTGSRSDYGLLYPVLKAIRRHKDLNFCLVAAGSHLDESFGYTINEIKADGFTVSYEVNNLLSDDYNVGMARSLGDAILKFAAVFEEICPNILLICGDRYETFAAAITAIYMNILIAHIHGGDRSVGGHIDDSVRHSIAKLAHIHFDATDESAERIIKMGEEPSRVFVVGAPGLDDISSGKFFERDKVAKKFNLDLRRPILLVIQNSVTTEVDKAAGQMHEAMEAIVELGEQAIVVYPNADAGGRAMIKVIEKYRDYPFIQVHKSLPHNTYLGLLRIVSVMIGNSSSGIIEAPSFHLPVVNIGTRQEGRQRAKNVIDIDHNRKEIIRGIKKALYDEEFRDKVKKCNNPYGDGKAGQRIADILSKIKIDKRLLQKRMTY